VEGCKAILTGGSFIYRLNPSSAEAVWKDVSTVSDSHVIPVRITTKLPIAILDIIRTHGEVGYSSRFSKPFSVETVTTLAGSTSGNQDGSGSNAQFNGPVALCLNPRDECLYVCDYSNNCIRRTSMQGEVSTFVGSNSLLRRPRGIAFHFKKNCFFITNFDAHTIIKITSSGVASVFAGGDNSSGNVDGVGTNARFHSPGSITIDQQSGNLFVSDYSNNLIRKITPQGEVSTLAGSQGGFADGMGQSAKFNAPWGICFDENSQSLLVCDRNNSKLRRVRLNGEVTTVCDIPNPAGVAVTSNQSILVVSATHKLYKAAYLGGQQYETVILAGTGKGGRVDGRADSCSFNYPYGIAVHEPSNACFIADYSNYAIRKVLFATPV